MAGTMPHRYGVAAALGWHPLRIVLPDASFRYTPTGASSPGVELCGKPRGSHDPVGLLENFRDFLPVDLAVETHSYPSAVSDIRRPEVAT